MLISDLPNEIIAEIISYLPLISWTTCQASSKIFHVDSKRALSDRNKRVDKVNKYYFKKNKGLAYAAKIGDDEVFSLFLSRGASRFVKAVKKSIIHNHINITIRILMTHMELEEEYLVIDQIIVSASRIFNSKIIDFYYGPDGVELSYDRCLTALVKSGASMPYIVRAFTDYILDNGFEYDSFVYDKLSTAIGRGCNFEALNYFSKLIDLNYCLYGASKTKCCMIHDS